MPDEGAQPSTDQSEPMKTAAGPGPAIPLYMHTHTVETTRPSPQLPISHYAIRISIGCREISQVCPVLAVPALQHAPAPVRTALLWRAGSRAASSLAAHHNKPEWRHA
jgi:hypothetical protein